MHASPVRCHYLPSPFPFRLPSFPLSPCFLPPFPSLYSLTANEQHQIRHVIAIDPAAFRYASINRQFDIVRSHPPRSVSIQPSDHPNRFIHPELCPPSVAKAVSVMVSVCAMRAVKLGSARSW
ncbi:hypothetical protein GE21DRAFT_1069075 [Neurospora crassa]|nr:hypothetical protein GE21DRAFT_1069075 [Neurospora crassa]